ncbi:MAG: hypothetical protein GVY15_07350 [Bacteroidetes bacterium]|nr:hypothetical protein [Bacteroidota bacterium]
MPVQGSLRQASLRQASLRQASLRQASLRQAMQPMLCSQRLRISNRRSGWCFQEMGVVLLVVDWPDGGRGVALAGVDHEECQQCCGGK